MSVDLRDFQKNKVYDAEDAVWSFWDHKVQHFNDVDSVVAFVNKILEYKRIRATYGRYIDEKTIEVTFCTRSSWSLAEHNEIKIAAKKGVMPHAILVVHELAHVLQYRMHPDARVAAHGQEFCRIYLDLIRIVFGKEMYQDMVDSFNQFRVKF